MLNKFCSSISYYQTCGLCFYYNLWFNLYLANSASKNITYLRAERVLLKCVWLPFKCFTRFSDIWVYFHVYLILLYRICSQSLGNDQNMAWFIWCSSYGLGRHGFRQGVVVQQHLREVAISKAASFPYSYLLGNLEWAKCSGVPQQCDSGRCACDTSKRRHHRGALPGEIFV